MDHQVGRIDLIRWQGQGRRNRRPGFRVGLWAAAFVVAGALFGVAMVAIQATGWLHWAGLLAMAPAGLAIALAVIVQLGALFRATAAWFARS